MPERSEVLEKIKQHLWIAKGMTLKSLQVVESWLQYTEPRKSVLLYGAQKSVENEKEEQVPETDLGGVVAKAHLKRRTTKEVWSSLSESARK